MSGNHICFLGGFEMEKKPISVSKEELNENLFEDVLFPKSVQSHLSHH